MGYHRWELSDFETTIRSGYLRVLKEYDHNLLGIIGTGGFDVFSVIRDLRRGLLLPELQYFVIAVEKRYGVSEQVAEKVMINIMLGDINVAGRRVLLLDDIVDKRYTSEAVYRRVQELNPADVKLLVVDSKTELSVPGWILRRTNVWEIYPSEDMETIVLLILGESTRPTVEEKIRDIVHRMGTSERRPMIHRITQRMKDTDVNLDHIRFLYNSLEELGIRNGLYSILGLLIEGGMSYT